MGQSVAPTKRSVVGNKNIAGNRESVAQMDESVAEMGLSVAPTRRSVAGNKSIAGNKESVAEKGQSVAQKR